MADDSLPREFDAIVLGTGMTECILAAALARIGYSVLHLDRNDYYSSEWATFNFDGLQRWIEQEKTRAIPQTEGLPEVVHGLIEGEKLVPLPKSTSSISNIEEEVYVKLKPDEVEEIALGVDETHITAKEDLDSQSKSVEQNETEEGQGHETETDLCETDLNKSPDNQSMKEKVTVAEENVKVNELPEKENDSETLENKNESAKLKHESKETEIKSTENETKSTQSEEQNLTDSNTQIQSRPNENQSSDADASSDGATSDKDASTQSQRPVTSPVKKVEPPKPKEWSLEDIKKEWRRFNLDVAPKLLYSRGAMVELLISSDIAKYCEFKTVSRILTHREGKLEQLLYSRGAMVELLISSDIAKYCEFKTVSRILTHREGKLEQVPCSRADVFGSKAVSMIEKRMLMKFLTFCLKYEEQPEEYQGFADKPFIDFLKSKKLSATVLHYVLNAIAMSTEKTNTVEGLKRTQRFLHSIGRYGNTPFLWPMYGSGELPQCFCRMCAVFAGIYILRRSAQAVIMDGENRCKGIVCTEGLRLKCNWLIMESGIAPPTMSEGGQKRFTSRAMFITDKSILPQDQEHISLLHLPPANGQDDPVTVIEVGPAAMACPKGLFVVHMFCPAVQSAKEDLQPLAQMLFETGETPNGDNSKPKILWCLYFNQVDDTGCDLNSNTPGNVFLTPGPGASVDCKHAVEKAREIFEKICPDDEFLPRAPNPEDIIPNDGEAMNNDSGFEADNDESSQGNDEDGDVEVARQQGGEDHAGEEWEQHGSDIE